MNNAYVSDEGDETEDDFPPVTMPRPACSHAWIDPDDPPIARASYSPVIGPLRRQMKAGKTYRCMNCGDELRVAGTEGETR